MKNKFNANFFIILLLIVLYLAGLVIWPFIGFIILAVVIAYTTYPFYSWLLKKIKRKNLTTNLMVFLVFILLLLPTSFLLSSLISQGTSALSNVDGEFIQEISDNINEKFGFYNSPSEIGEPSEIINAITDRTRDFLLSQSINLIGSIVDILIGIVIMFFVLFYLFRDGKDLYQALIETLPLRHKHKQVLFGEMQLVTNAVIYGQLVISLIQGVAGGLAFVIFGLNNAIFWGFVIALISFLPIVGTPIIFIPAGIIELFNHNYVSGFGIMIFGVLLVMNVDSIVKPLIISERSRLNAALILIGVIGGLKIFGFMGFIIGPLVLALLFALLQVFRQDFKPSDELKKASKHNDKSLIISLHKRPADEHRIINKKNKGVVEK